MVNAIISEMFISDYLILLADDMAIQPINRMTVQTHRTDELAHSNIFKQLTKAIYHGLNEEQREFFTDILPKPVRWFANSELTVWRSMLKQIGFPHVDRVIADCEAASEINLMRIDFSHVTRLAEQLGILETANGNDNFAREGLVSSTPSTTY